MKLLAALLLLLLSSSLLAWGGDGHQIVAIIAEERLTPEAKAMVHELLGDDVNISDAEICNWADEIRRERRETAPWHYVNIPTTQPSYDPARDGTDNVITAIERFEKVLADKRRPKEERAEALKFIVHFVADLHQPCHTTERNGDRGGNGRLVFFLEKKKAVTLHAVWDTQILLNRKGKTRVLDYARALNERITAKQAAAWSKGTPTDWVNEAHKVAVEQVYRDVPDGSDPPKIEQPYVDRCGPVVDEQLKRAGARLAGVLNRSSEP